jgi:two-component system, OmpR family, response regulator MprA
MEKTKRRILCVDDDQDTCEMMSVLLGTVGYEVSCALTLSEGLRLAKQEQFALILLDWTFPDGTGLELCQMIRNFDPQTPIFFCSGVSIGAESKRAMNAGAQGFFVKPLAMNDFLSNVSSLTGNDPGASSHAS